MGFLTVLNYIAMGIGYIVLLFILIFVVWSIIETIKEKNHKKKWERERAEKERAEKEKSKSVEKDANQNKESLVDESGKIKVVN